MAQTLYRPAHGACTHSHPTIVDALECARNSYSGLEIVALRNGHVERLNGAEERIRSAASALYQLTEREILDIHWEKSLSGFTDAERDIIYARWKQSGTFVPVPAPRKLPETTPYRNRYKCPYGDKNCGENAIYCEPCNKKYAEFLLLLNDDR